LLLGALSPLLLNAAGADGHEDAAARGAAVYQKYCVLCHGAQGSGDGRAASLQKARPADLTLSTRSDAYKAQMIRLGGEAMQRSGSMPSWTDVLSEQQIQDVVVYLRTLVQRAAVRDAATPEPGAP
jgi:mono/diheme cytochrome c family protein